MPHAPRLASLPPPLQHAAVELLRGTMTKHDFIAYRDDRAGESQPISFEGEGLAALCAPAPAVDLVCRERRLPGASAVLINRAHAYPDLALPINPAQDRVFARLTASVPLARFCGAAKLGQGREFFERLWSYDQIVSTRQTGLTAARGGWRRTGT